MCILTIYDRGCISVPAIPFHSGNCPKDHALSGLPSACFGWATKEFEGLPVEKSLERSQAARGHVNVLELLQESSGERCLVHVSFEFGGAVRGGCRPQNGLSHHDKRFEAAFCRESASIQFQSEIGFFSAVLDLCLLIPPNRKQMSLGS